MFEELTNEQREVIDALHVKLVDTITANRQDLDVAMSERDLDVAILATCTTLIYLLTHYADARERSKTTITDAIVDIVEGLTSPVDTTQLPVTDNAENVF